MVENTQGTILIVDDDPDIQIAGRLLLKRHFGKVITLSTPEDIPAILSSTPPDVILLDMNFGPGESSGQAGFEWLGRIRAQDSEVVVIMITAHGGVKEAVDAMKRGASDFVVKPWQNEKLLATVSAGLELSKTRRKAKTLTRSNERLAANSAKAEQPMLGHSPPMLAALTLIERAAPTDANVLILGENGTGKELAARALHRASRRADQIFMAVDLGAVSETLFESELFGHKKGAFTDARTDRIGLLEAASGGTLFLDEIGNLPLHLQAKLLTVLEQRRVTPVGASQSVPIDVRIIAATNRSPQDLANPNIFRTDLLFRLNTVEVTLPPLRDRAADIPELVTHYLRVYERRYDKPQKRVSDTAMERLQRYSWPGNVRTLRHSMERAVILSEQDAYEAEDFSLPDTARAAASRVETKQEENEPTASSHTLNLEQLEKEAVERALRTYRYNISHTAKALGLTRAALYRRMEKHGL
ncbi:sigma-54-dependent Fis family transcriptional regulator [Iodidimonas gelatinilytica]|uniref:Sigma-54-dependent Fis family transcriptional regulator n=1 Tax=Iodidimonas gelatinilytica TaxID=1236966 RepID=A0A5A7MQ04_9PROT|nr:sigma-54 dependent transcriptional regulator [Iodidimonas gelatinilytica]GEQ96998.1 sigma-54-dependent Fis family transcriptional regulator [Iodidimonas gelatinilytica]